MCKTNMNNFLKQYKKKLYEELNSLKSYYGFNFFNFPCIYILYSTHSQLYFLYKDRFTTGGLAQS